MDTKRIKELYPEGTRVKLINMEGEPSYKSGMEGTVTGVDDVGQIHVNWDNGGSLALNLDVDDFQVIPQGPKSILYAEIGGKKYSAIMTYDDFVIYEKDGKFYAHENDEDSEENDEEVEMTYMVLDETYDGWGVDEEERKRIEDSDYFGQSDDLSFVCGFNLV